MQACKASILLNLPESAKRKQGRVLLDTLLNRESPIVDLDALITIQDFAGQRDESDDPRLDLLWQRAAKASPQNEELHRQWFMSKFWAKHWIGAQKARKQRPPSICSMRGLINICL